MSATIAPEIDRGQNQYSGKMGMGQNTNIDTIIYRGFKQLGFYYVHFLGATNFQHAALHNPSPFGRI